MRGSPPLPSCSVLALLVVLIVISLRTGQGGSRLRGGDQAATDRMDDRNWKWGIFYVNSDDSSIMVERRYGIGWTFNFGESLGTRDLYRYPGSAYSPRSIVGYLRCALNQPAGLPQLL